MKIQYHRPVSHAAFWSFRFGLFAFVLFVISVGLHWFAIMESEIFLALFLIAAALALLAFLLAGYGIFQLWMVGAKGGRASAKAVLLAICVLVPSSGVAWRAYSLPQLYDISTDTTDVPAFIEPVTHKANWLSALNLEATAPYAGQLEAYPQVTGRRYEGALDRVLDAVNLVAANRGLRIIASRMPEPENPDSTAIDPEPLSSDETSVPDAAAPDDDEESDQPIVLSDETSEGETNFSEPAIPVPTQIVLQGVARAPMLGTLSDVSIRLSEEAETTFVDMRSVSRFGPHDFGANAQIISNFLTALDAELVGLSVR